MPDQIFQKLWIQPKFVKRKHRDFVVALYPSKEVDSRSNWTRAELQRLVNRGDIDNTDLYFRHKGYWEKHSEAFPKQVIGNINRAWMGDDGWIYANGILHGENKLSKDTISAIEKGEIKGISISYLNMLLSDNQGSRIPFKSFVETSVTPKPHFKKARFIICHEEENSQPKRMENTQSNQSNQSNTSQGDDVSNVHNLQQQRVAFADKGGDPRKINHVPEGKSDPEAVMKAISGLERGEMSQMLTKLITNSTIAEKELKRYQQEDATRQAEKLNAYREDNSKVAQYGLRKMMDSKILDPKDEQAVGTYLNLLTKPENQWAIQTVNSCAQTERQLRSQLKKITTENNKMKEAVHMYKTMTQSGMWGSPIPMQTVHEDTSADDYMVTFNKLFEKTKPSHSSNSESDHIPSSAESSHGTKRQRTEPGQQNESSSGLSTKGKEKESDGFNVNYATSNAMNEMGQRKKKENMASMNREMWDELRGKGSVGQGMESCIDDKLTSKLWTRFKSSGTVPLSCQHTDQ